MKFADEFRDRSLVTRLLERIRSIAGGEPVQIMEVCGTHTMAIMRSGIKQALPASVKLISGPGCPVCVTSQTDIDAMLALSRARSTIITTFGDMLKVPGTRSSLEKERAAGADVRPVYSPLDSLAVARQNPRKEVVFLAVGFETTAPAVAATISDAAREGLKNFSVYSCHKLIPPAIKTLLQAKELHIHGFLCPGHVSSIIGARAYDFISRRHGIPCVIAGFEPTDILESILMLLEQRAGARSTVQIQYTRAVQSRGNAAAQQLIARVFSPAPAQWRGLGSIAGSGLALRSRYRSFDARRRFRLGSIVSAEPKHCSCGQVLRGVVTPEQCRLFARACTPQNPVGPCMVSTEGTCAAWYAYGRNTHG